MFREKGAIARACMDFADELRGSAMEPGDLGVDEARRSPNGALDGRPALIAHVADVADVQCALAFARSEGLSVAVRRGGYQDAGHAAESGLVIDLSLLKGVAIDPVARMVRVGTGLGLAELDAATQTLGL